MTSTPHSQHEEHLNDDLPASPLEKWVWVLLDDHSIHHLFLKSIQKTVVDVPGHGPMDLVLCVGHEENKPDQVYTGCVAAALDRAVLEELIQERIEAQKALESKKAVRLSAFGGSVGEA